MSDSIWKKEISFGKRKPKDGEAQAGVEQAEHVVDPGVPEAPTAPKQSIWKKDLSLGKKKDAPVAPEAPTAPKQSVWKKELSFGKKKEVDEVDRLAEEAALAVSEAFGPAAPEPPRELLPTAIAEAAVAAMPDPSLAGDEPALEPPALPEAPVAPVAPEAPIAPEVSVAPVAPVAPVSPLSAAVVAASEDAAPVDPPAYEPPVVESVPAEPQEYEPVPAEPQVYETAAPEPVAAPVGAEPWLAEPELPPEPAAAAAVAAVVVHPPVPAAELPPVVEPKVPFYKRELSLGSKKQKAPKAAKAPKPPKEPKTSKAEKQKQPKAKGEGPFWKKELSFRRSPKQAAAVEAVEVAAVAAAPKGKPAWKRELSLPKLSKPSLLSTRGGKGGGSAKRYVGLKIGASQLAAARVSNNGVAELLQLAREPLAQGVVVAGELREPDALADALKIFFAKHKLPRKNVRLGIASNRIGVRILDVVGIEDDKQLANAVQFRAQEALPIPLDEAVLDYRVLEEVVDAEGRPAKRVLLVVAYRDLVDRYVSACRKAGIVLAGIDLEAFALLRSLAAPTERGAAAMVAVSVGHDRSTFAVTDGSACEFTRVLEWGGWAINVALARVLDVAPSEVESIKRQLSLDTGAPVEGLTPEQNAAALDAVRKQLSSFARELVSSLQFYQGQPGSLAFGSIILTGGTAHMPGLARELEQLTGVRVEIGNPLARLKVSKRVVAPEPLGSLAVAIGLGIED